MTHYILLDLASGYIFADTRNLAGFSESKGTPADAGRIIAEQMGVVRLYREVNTYYHTYNAEYAVYRVDVNGSEVVPVVYNGQDQETIEAVEKACPLDCYLVAA